MLLCESLLPGCMYYCCFACYCVLGVAVAGGLLQLSVLLLRFVFKSPVVILAVHLV